MRAIAQRNVKVVKYNRGVKVIKAHDTALNREVTKLYGFCEIVTEDRGTYYDELAYDEYVQRTSSGEKNHFWKSKPETMIKKCAEASVLRMLAPEDLSGVYLDEEMDTVVINGTKRKLTEDQLEEEKKALPDPKHSATAPPTAESTEEVIPQNTKATAPPTQEQIQEIKYQDIVEDKKLDEGVRKSDADKYMAESELKKQFRSLKTYGQCLSLWNNISKSQKREWEEKFIKKMMDTAETVEQLSKLVKGMSYEMHQKFAEQLSEKRNQMQGIVQEDFFKVQKEEELNRLIDNVKTKKELQQFAKLNKKSIDALEPASYARISNRLEILEQKLLDY